MSRKSHFHPGSVVLGITLAGAAAVALGLAPQDAGADLRHLAANPQLGITGSVLTSEQAEILGHMSIVLLNDGFGNTLKTIRIEGVNVQIVNGAGDTEMTNGLGNLVIGYNELGNLDGDDRTGSHNLVGGSRSSYSSYGGIVVGQHGTVSGPYGAVTGGWRNTASGMYAAVGGGAHSTASGTYATVGGGQSNSATANFATVSGGEANMASEISSTVSGGWGNSASGQSSAVSGGRNNTADGDYSAVSGGHARTVSIANTSGDMDDDWVAGSVWEDN